MEVLFRQVQYMAGEDERLVQGEEAES